MPDPLTVTILLLLLGSLWWFIHLLRRITTTSSPHSHKNVPQLPPGPRGLPIIGNLHMLGHLPHRSLQKLSLKYGPIMSLHLGSVPTIIVSSPEAAKLFLKTHDAIFASRPKVREFVSYGAKGIAFTEYGPYWRSARKFSTLELLNPAKISSLAGMRREELDLCVKSLKEAAAAGKVVDVSEVVSGLIENFVCRMLFERSKEDRFDLKGMIQRALAATGAFNIADFVPSLAPFDPQGFTRRLKASMKEVDEILETMIDEHESNASGRSQNHNRNFIDIMLSMKGKRIYSHDEFTINRTNIKALILDMIVGSIGTSNTIIEWCICELIRHPMAMKRLQEEIKAVVGDDEIVKEIDLPKLEYLDMVIKEAFRLYPVAPLLIPRESIEDIVINGYYIPKRSRVIINAWAIGRDPNVWSENVDDFFPERFIGSKIDVQGRDFELLPFGSGRRVCPGMNLGLVKVRLVMAQLVHCFDWKLPGGMSHDDLDMGEAFGLSMPRAKHLLAIPSYRL